MFTYQKLGEVIETLIRNTLRGVHRLRQASAEEIVEKEIQDENNE